MTKTVPARYTLELKQEAVTLVKVSARISSKAAGMACAAAE